MTIVVITPVASTALSWLDKPPCRCPWGSLPRHGGIPGVLPSKGLWGAEAPLSKGRGSIRDPQELADVSPLWANLDHLGFAHQIPVGWDVHCGGWIRFRNGQEQIYQRRSRGKTICFFFQVRTTSEMKIRHISHNFKLLSIQFFKWNIDQFTVYCYCFPIK